MFAQFQATSFMSSFVLVIDLITLTTHPHLQTRVHSESSVAPRLNYFQLPRCQFLFTLSSLFVALSVYMYCICLTCLLPAYCRRKGWDGSVMLCLSAPA